MYNNRGAGGVLFKLLTISDKLPIDGAAEGGQRSPAVSNTLLVRRNK